MIINPQYRCTCARISRYGSVVKFGMTWDFDSQFVGSSPTAPLLTGSKSTADGWFWVPAVGGSNPPSPIQPHNEPLYWRRQAKLVSPRFRKPVAGDELAWGFESLRLRLCGHYANW